MNIHARKRVAAVLGWVAAVGSAACLLGPGVAFGQYSLYISSENYAQGRIVLPLSIASEAQDAALNPFPVPTNTPRVQISAEPLAGYEFDSWQVNGDPAARIDSVRQKKTYLWYSGRAALSVVARFVRSGVVLDISSKDSAGETIGAPTPHSGPAVVPFGSVHALAVTSPVDYPSLPGKRAVAIGWTATGSAPASGAGSVIGNIIVTNATKVTWRWTEEFLLTVNVVGGTGVVSRVPAKSWYTNAEAVQLMAYRTGSDYFQGWDDGVLDNPRTITMDRPRTINAVFGGAAVDTDGDGLPDWWEKMMGLDWKDGSPDSPHGANGDPDNDGLMNAEEYRCSANGIYADPLHADSDGDGMDDGYEFRHMPLGTNNLATPGNATNAVAVLNREGVFGPKANVDQDFKWDTDTGYMTGIGLTAIEEYVGPDGIVPGTWTNPVDLGFGRLVYRYEGNVNDTGDQSYPDTTDSEIVGGRYQGDGFDDGYEYTWDLWQSRNGGVSARDPLGRLVPWHTAKAARPVCVEIGQLGGGGGLDAAICNEGRGSVSVLYGAANGTFNPPGKIGNAAVDSEWAVGKRPVALVIADLDGNGPRQPGVRRGNDIVVANRGTNTISVLIRAGNTYTDAVHYVVMPYTPGEGPTCVDTGDFDRDGDQDVVVSLSTGGLVILLNNGTGRLTTHAVLPTLGSADYVRVANLRSHCTNANEDVVLDLAVAMASVDQVAIFTNTGAASFVPGPVLAVGDEPKALVIAEFDGDMYNDLAVVHYGSDDIYSYKGVGNGTFSTRRTRLIGNNFGCRHLASGLLDFRYRQGAAVVTNMSTDVLVVNEYVDSVNALLGADDDVRFTPGEVTHVGHTPMWVSMAYLNGDDLVDFIVACRDGDAVEVYFGRGDSTFNFAASYSVSEVVSDRRYNPGALHVVGLDGGRPDYDLLYNDDSGRAMAWFTDNLEYKAWMSMPGKVSTNALGVPVTNMVALIRPNIDAPRCTHPFFWDGDNDGMPDGWEMVFGYDPWLKDTDGDRITDDQENPDGDDYATDGTLRHHDVYLTYGFHPRTGWQTGLLYPNTDFYVNYQELIGDTNRPALFPGDRGERSTHPLKIDTDGDGIWDGWEFYIGVNPYNSRFRLSPFNQRDGGEDGDVCEYIRDFGFCSVHSLAPGDGLSNFEEFRSYATSTNDGGSRFALADWANKTYPCDPWDYDTDWDQLGDGVEFLAFNYMGGTGIVVRTSNAEETGVEDIDHQFYLGSGLCPTTCDTDGDHLPDAWELVHMGVSDGRGGWTNGMDGARGDSQADCDSDGLRNYQEYMIGSVYCWNQYYNDGTYAFQPYQGLYGYEPYDFFNPDMSAGGKWYVGPGGRWTMSWDPYRYVGPFPPRVPFRWMTATDPFFVHSLRYATGNPCARDTDADGLDDLYETFHGSDPMTGLNPAKVLMPTRRPLVPGPMIYHEYPWLAGTIIADLDQDDIAHGDEGIFADSPPPPKHHSDPSPLWATDWSSQFSWVNQYYWLGTYFGDPGLEYWYFDEASMRFAIPGPTDVSPPTYMFDHEYGEGYDTDNDFYPDRIELVSNEASPGSTPPVESMSPIKRRAALLNGQAAARGRMALAHGPTVFRLFTVQAWVRPTRSIAGVRQHIVERSGIVPSGNPLDLTPGVRANFRLGLDAAGVPFAQYHAMQKEIVSVEAKASSAAPLRNNTWYHLATTLDGEVQKNGHWTGMLRLYVDGELASASPTADVTFNGWTSVEEGLSNVWSYARIAGLIMVIGARDENPSGVVDGSTILNGPLTGLRFSQPSLTEHFYGWVDKVEVWDGPIAQTAIRSNRFKRHTRSEIRTMMMDDPQAVYDPVTGPGIPVLKYYVDFDDMVDPSHSTRFPYGFDVLNGRPIGCTATYWWSSANDRSRAYDDYLFVPFIENRVNHFPLDPPRDSTLACNGSYPNLTNPYNIIYRHAPFFAAESWGAVQAQEINATSVVIIGSPYVPDFMTDTAVQMSDFLPLGWLEADEDVEMWDKGGKGIDPYDSDGDMLPDAWEERWGLDPLDVAGNNGTDGDMDGDGLSNFYEYMTVNNPHSRDSSGDGMTDSDEDFDKDGLNNRSELTAGTLPHRVDTDDDGVTDWEELTGSTDWLYNATRPKTSRRPQIVTNPLDPLEPGIKRCMAFDGKSRLIVPPSDKLMTENWTAEMWVHPATNNQGGVLLSRYVEGVLPGQQGINYEVGLKKTTKKGVLRPYVRYVTKDGVEVRVDGTTATEQTNGLAPVLITETNWFHVAGTYSKDTFTLSLYVNGLLASFRTDAAAMPPTVFGYKTQHIGDEVTVGASRSSGAVSQGFRGYIDEVRVWRVTRTAEQIHDMYNGISVLVSVGEPTTGPSYESLGSAQKQAVDNKLAAARVAAAAGGGTYTVAYSPVMAIDISKLCGMNMNPNALPLKASAVPFVRAPNLRLPASFDWRDHDGVTPIKNQAACGSCWAFGTCAGMESTILIADKTVQDLSEQVLVSCNLDGFGCGGGFMAFDYFVDRAASDGAVGAALETAFPYAAADLPCAGPYARAYKAQEWGWLGAGPGDLNIPEQTIKEAVYKYGNIPVAVYVGPAFQGYSSGVFNTHEVSPTGFGNHCVTIVGWNDPGRYWIIKNSWGAGWGESGFMRIGYGISGVGQGAAYVKYRDVESGGSTLALELRFDDGGATAQDFTELADWMNDWASAARMESGPGTVAGIQFSTNTTPPLDKDSDGDGMPDWWEVSNGLDPLVGEGDDGAWGDPDRDELNNIYEYFEGTAPRDPDSDNDGFIDYDSLRDPQGNGRTFGERRDDGDRIPDAWEIRHMGVCDATGNRGLDPSYYDANLDPDEDGWSNYAEYMGYYAGAVNVTRSSDPLSATNYPTPSVQIRLRYNGLLGPDIDTALAAGTRTVHLDFYNVKSMDGFPVATLDMTRSVLTTNRFTTGHLVEGTNFVFAYIDLDASGTWNPTNEPAGLADPHPSIGWGNVNGIEIGLADSRHGYPRFGWPVRNGVLGYDVKFMQGSTTVFRRFVWNASRNYIHDQDYIVGGRLGLPNGSYNCQVYRTESVLGSVYTNLHAVQVVIVDRAVQALPTFVTGHGSTFVYAKNDLAWKMSTGATAYRIAVSTARGGSPIAGTVRTLPAPYRDRSGNFRAPLPFLAGDANADGTTTFANGTYWVAVTSYGPGSTSPTNWISLNVSLATPPNGGKSAISGNVYYFGKVAHRFGATRADGLPIIVQTFQSAGFSGEPDAQVQTKYVCVSNPPASDPKFQYHLLGLHNGQHAIRAFIDLNGNRQLDLFEPYGFARENVDNWDYTPRMVDLGDSGSVQVEGVDLVIRDRDTDDDGLPDGWEWMYYGNMDKGGDDIGANLLPLKTSYEIDPRDLNPTITDYDGDGLSDLFEVTYSDRRTGMLLGPTHYDPYHPILNPNGKDLNPAKTDTDGDGLSDGYEISKGLDPINPYGDADGDGVTDAAEVFIAGTDPANRADVLAIEKTGISAAGEGAFTLEWDGRAGVTYQVQYSTDLRTWLDASNGRFQSATRTMHRYVEQAAAVGPRFYRVVVR